VSLPFVYKYIKVIAHAYSGKMDYLFYWYFVIIKPGFLVGSVSLHITERLISMSNEEKILMVLGKQGEMLETLVSEQQQTNQRLDRIEADVAELKTDVAELKTDVAELKTDVAELKTDVAELKADVARLKTDVARLETNVARLETNVARVETDVYKSKTTIGGRIDDLSKLVHAIAEHQNDDYDLLQRVDKKLDIISAMSYDHEQKFRKIKAI